MSTTVYQTTAKPRGRKDLEQVDIDVPNSRASSQASQRLAKTVSRTIEEFQSPAKSRSGSPFFWHRNKAIDPSVQRDTALVSSQKTPSDDLHNTQRPLSMTFVPTAHDAPVIPGAFPLSSPDQQQPSITSPSTISRVMSQTQPRARRSTSTSRTRSLTQSSIARMQPTVVDASDDEVARGATTARSSATSLELKSTQGSDLGMKPIKSTTPPPPPPPNHSPPKPPTIDAQKATKDYPGPTIPGTSTPRRASFRSSTGPTTSGSNHHLYNAPPSSFPGSSPHQYSADARSQPQQGTALPAVSPPHSPTLMHQPMYNTMPVASYPYGYPPQTGPGQGSAQAYYNDAQHLPSPPPSSTFANTRGTGTQEDSRDWAKLTSVLPELNRLLNKYEGQKGQTSSKDSFASQLDHHRTHEIASLRVELEANKSEYEKVIQKLVTESFALKREIEDRNKDVKTMHATITDLKKEQETHNTAQSKHLEVVSQQNKLREKHDAAEAKNQQMSLELQAAKTTHDQLQKKYGEMLNEVQFYRNEAASWKSKYQEAAGASDQARLAQEGLVATRMRLEAGMEDLRRKSQAREEKHQSEIKVLKREYEALLETKEKERGSLSTEHKAAIGSVQLELAGLIDRHSRQKKELESAKNHSYNLEKKLDAKYKEREEQSARHRQQLEAKTKEMEELAASHRRQLEAQLASVTAQREKEFDALKRDHEKAAHALRKEHDAKINRIHEDHASEMRKVHADLNKQKSVHEAHLRETDGLRTRHGELASAMVSWKKRQDEWQAEQDKLSAIMAALNLGREK